MGERICRELQRSMRDELLDCEIFYTPREARTVIESWRRHYNGDRPHSALGYQAPAPETTVFLPPARLPLAQKPAEFPTNWAMRC